ncbi:hypothetical protein [Devosia sp. 1635]|uniref:hypothetical protein n=1 Tax=Devosia sp. 1635 TaxID=2726066 RepID=UPI001565C540|nr:hypothetical protein [Devosia sp. 1635]
MSNGEAIPAPGGAREQLAAHWHLLQRDFAASQCARLSLRKAWLVAVLLDHVPDRIWDACIEAGAPLPHGAPDFPSYRAWLRSSAPALADIFALVALQPDGPRLELLPVAVPAEAVEALPVEDFMISLYNDNHIQQLMLTTAAGAIPAHDRLAAAMESLGKELDLVRP